MPQQGNAFWSSIAKVPLDLLLRKGIIDRVITEESKNIQVAPSNKDLLLIQEECFAKITEAIEELKDGYKILAHKAEIQFMMARKEALDKELDILTKKAVPMPGSFLSSRSSLILSQVSDRGDILAEKESEKEIERGDHPRVEKRKVESLNSYGLFSSPVFESKRAKGDDLTPDKESETEDETYLVIADYDEDEDEDTTPSSIQFLSK